MASPSVSAAQSVKICLVGDARVGKSALLNEFCGRPFNSAHYETRGLVTESCYLGPGAPAIAAELLDHRPNMSTSEKPSFYRSADFVLLVYDITSHASFESATGRLFREGQHYAPEAIFILIGCKMDLNLDRQVTIKEAETFATNAGLFFMEVSCREHTNIELTLKIMRIRAQHILRRRLSAPPPAPPRKASPPRAPPAAVVVPSPPVQRISVSTLPPEPPQARKLDAATETPPREKEEKRPVSSRISSTAVATNSSSVGTQPDPEDGIAFANPTYVAEPAAPTSSSAPDRHVDAAVNVDEDALYERNRLRSSGVQTFDHLNSSNGSHGSSFRVEAGVDTSSDSAYAYGGYDGSSSLDLETNSNNNDTLTALQDRYLRLKAELQSMNASSGVSEDGDRDDDQLSVVHFSPPHVKNFERTTDGSVVPVVETALSREGVSPAMAVASPTQMLTELPVHSSVYERNRHIQTSPSRIMRASATPPKEPRLLIDINIGDGRMGQIGVREGDNAYVLADTFVRAFRLDRSFVRKLAALIQTRVQEFTLEQKRQLGRPASARPASAKATVSPQPFNFTSENRKSNRNEVLLRLHVDVGKGKFGIIAVRKGDDPAVLARNFAQTFSLKPERIEEIEAKIREQILNYFLREASGQNNTSSQASSGDVSGDVTPTRTPPDSARSKRPAHTLFYLDIDIGRGKTARLRVTDVDKAAELAASFCEEHHLDARAQSRLEVLIARNIKTYAPR